MSTVVVNPYRYTAATYLSKVLSYSPTAVWPLNELSGTTAVNAEGTAARNGTYTSVTLDSTAGPVAGERAGRWNGTTSYCDIYSSSLNSAFNGQLFTMMVWAKVFDVNVWTDGTTRRFAVLTVDGNNEVNMGRLASSGVVRWQYMASGTIENRDKGSLNSVGWNCYGMTVSKASDRVRVYYNGVQEGADLGTLGTWSGSLQSDSCMIGARNTTPQLCMNGYLAYVSIFPSELNAAAMLDLATI